MALRLNTPTQLICHHTGGSDANPLQDSSNFTFAQCNELHKNNPSINLGVPSGLGYYIGYHYYIEKSGLVTQGRLDTDEGAHTVGQNTSSLGICLAGNFDATDPTPEQVASLTDLLNQKSKQYNISSSRIFPHRHYTQKTCYGKRLSDTWASSLVAQTGTQAILDQIIFLVGQVQTLLTQLKNHG